MATKLERQVVFPWLPFLTLAIWLYCADTVDALGCFVCSSINHSEPECEDTFNNTGRFYVDDCWSRRKERDGLFPGTQCIKMTAENPVDHTTYVVRNCVVDDGGLTSETEIGREDHCGWLREMKYDNKKVHGCIVTCEENGCNFGNSLLYSSLWTTISVSLSTLALVYISS